ncbi:MAG: DEAD/DEAH box helicase [Propionibacteriaceae bacterium]|nr:DEAD/DEAH box helicase [Propionibacteriaceae bacterium]
MVDSLTAAGFTAPFPIQTLAIPIALQGSDLIGQARTGTGKTLAFGIPLLQRLNLTDPDPEAPVHVRPRALVLCPTRELALQVTGDLAIAGAGSQARVLTVYGGVGYDTQLDTLTAGVDVVVGTPGRIIDLMDRKALQLDQISELVLDEADEMLDLGFLPDVERIIAQTPADGRQTMLFSATMPSAILALARSHLQQPINIRAEAHDSPMTVPQTTQFVYQAHDLDKPTIVGKLLQSPSATRVMVFCRTKRGVQRLTDDLTDRGFSATCIHGDLSQVIRERALKRFRAGQAQVIVATDVAARGIDVDSVTHVVNYDCPDDEKTYVHRIGRTGRAGNIGVAITLVDWSDLNRWKIINQTLGLPFDEPMEAYSTTPQLLADLDIPETATGRLKPSSATMGSSSRRSETRDHRRGDRSDARHDRSPGRGRRSDRAGDDHEAGGHSDSGRRRRTRRDRPDRSDHQAGSDQVVVDRSVSGRSSSSSDSNNLTFAATSEPVTTSVATQPSDRPARQRTRRRRSADPSTDQPTTTAAVTPPAQPTADRQQSNPVNESDRPTRRRRRRRTSEVPPAE